LSLRAPLAIEEIEGAEGQRSDSLQRTPSFSAACALFGPFRAIPLDSDQSTILSPLSLSMTSTTLPDARTPVLPATARAPY
jgi:hypothetical protein